MTMTPDSTLDARRRRTVVWIVSLATVGLIFDGYDLVVYGTVVSTFLRDPSHIGNVTPAIAGALGSYALVGVLVGALLAGTVGDILGRRKVMLFAYAWFSVGMAMTATTIRSPANAGPTPSGVPAKIRLRVIELRQDHDQFAHPEAIDDRAGIFRSTP